MKYAELVTTIDTASLQLLGRAAAVVNQALVLRNWLVGAYVVEYEQGGKDRAKYGARLLERLADDLAKRGLKGLGLSSLRNCRQFYLMYPQIRQSVIDEFWDLPEADRICQSPIGELPNPAAGSMPAIVPASQLPTPLSPELVLQFSWTKLVELIRLDDPLKRAFYENECLKGNWSVR